MAMDKGDMVETKRQDKAQARLTKEKVVDVNYNIRAERDTRVIMAHFEENNDNVLSSSKADFVESDPEPDNESEPELCDLLPPVPGELLCTTQPEVEKVGKETGARRKEAVKRNLLPVPSTAETSLRFDVSTNCCCCYLQWVSS